jgi:uroporphyrinogen-III synthase
LKDIRTGPSDGGAVLALAARHGARRLLHLVGRDHLALEHPALHVERRVVYASDLLGLTDVAADALRRGATVLLHSARAAARFAELVDGAGLARSSARLVAISGNVADAAGPGWASVHVASSPRDPALLALAAQLCKNAPVSGAGLAQ